jgi:hypothetical protein
LGCLVEAYRLPATNNARGWRWLSCRTLRAKRVDVSADMSVNVPVAIEARNKHSRGFRGGGRAGVARVRGWV